jgi:hypothetical protein
VFLSGVKGQGKRFTHVFCTKIQVGQILANRPVTKDAALYIRLIWMLSAMGKIDE